jgi:hypothetical protein
MRKKQRSPFGGPPSSMRFKSREVFLRLALLIWNSRSATSWRGAPYEGYNPLVAVINRIDDVSASRQILSARGADAMCRGRVTAWQHRILLVFSLVYLDEEMTPNR